MMRSIVFKLSVAIIFLSLVIILPLGFTINKIFSGYYYNELETQLYELTDNYSKLITTMDDPNLLNMYETLAHMINRNIFIVNDEGIVVVNSGLPELMEGTKIYNEDLASLRNGYTIKKQYHDTHSDEKYLSVGKPVFHENQFVGGIFIAGSISGIYHSIDKVEKMIMLASVGSILVAIGFALFLSRRLSEPLLKMEQTTRKIAMGDLDSRVHLTSKDEIGSLAHAINDLAVELYRYRSNRREFFANISHELRTPITYIDGFSKALRKKLYKTEEEKEKMLSLIEQEANRMTKLVDDLFELAKMEEEKLLLHLEPVDITDPIVAAVAKTKLKAEKKGLEFQVKISENLPVINGDSHRLEQVFINLLENAIRYTEKGKLTVRGWSDKDDVYVSVEDTGMGIPDNNIAFLFERFYRVDKSRSRKLGGTGLGLAIVKQLVELHQGKIDVSSKVGEGSKFILVFPTQRREMNHEI